MPKDQSLHLQLPHFDFDSSQRLNTLYAIRVARDLVYKLAFFFLPIYLYQHGSKDSFWHFLPGGELQRGILLLAIFYFIHRLTVFLSAIPIGKFQVKIGYKKSLLIGFSLYAVFLSTLYASEQPGWVLLIGAVINGLETNFFWNSFYPLISKFTRKQHMGQNLGLVQFLLQVAQALAPALGGVLIVAFGFQSLFMVGLIGVLTAIIFTLQLELSKEYDRVSWHELKDWLEEASFVRLVSSQAGRYINDASVNLWPLYVFLILGAVDRVGYLYTLSLFLAMILSFLVGFYIDHKKNKRPYFVSGGMLTVLWLLRTQVFSVWQIVVVDTFEKITGSFHWLFFDATSIKRGKGGQALSYFVYREMIMSLFAMLFWVVIGAVFLFVSNPWTGLFLVAAVGVMMSLAVKEQR